MPCYSQKEGRPADAFFGAWPCIAPCMHCRNAMLPGQRGEVKRSSSALTAITKPANVSKPKLVILDSLEHGREFLSCQNIKAAVRKKQHIVANAEACAVC